MRRRCARCGQTYFFKHICTNPVPLRTVSRTERVSPIRDDSMDILLQAAVVHSILENDSPRQEDRFEPGGGEFGGAGASGSWSNDSDRGCADSPSDSGGSDSGGGCDSGSSGD